MIKFTKAVRSPFMLIKSRTAAKKINFVNNLYLIYNNNKDKSNQFTENMIGGKKNGYK